MAARVPALITPALLEWARRTAGFSVDAAAERLAVASDRVTAWEHGREGLSVAQLKKLASLYKRPLALFYLPAPPKDFTPMKDFRRLPSATAALSAELLLEVRRARQRRDVALDLAEALEQTPKTFPIRATLDEIPANVAERLRAALGVTLTQQEGWADAYEALREWRAAAERLGVLVFRAQHLDPKESRGFSLGEEKFPVVVFSSKDAPAARVFTIVHELAHVALRSGGVCDFDEVRAASSFEERTEVFCNAVAGETLIPLTALLNAPEVRTHAAGTSWSDDSLRAMARRFGVSREVTLRRLVAAQKASLSMYQTKRREWQAIQQPKPGGGFERQDEKALRENGRLYAQLVVASYHEKTISVGEASDFLNVKTRYIDAVERALQMSRSSFA